MRAAAGLVLVVSLLAPGLALAEEPVSAISKQTLGICNRINELSTVVTQRLDEKKKGLSDRRAAAGKAMEERKQSREQGLTDIETKNDGRRSEIYAKLHAKATTDAHREAVDAFQKAVDDAVAVRREAVRSANTTFVQGVKDAVAGRKSAADAAVKSFHDAIQSAVGKAKTDCAAKADQVIVRAQFAEAVKTAGAKLRTDLQAVEKFGISVKPLIDARRAAAEKARADFKAAVEKARFDLKAAFGK